MFATVSPPHIQIMFGPTDTASLSIVFDTQFIMTGIKGRTLDATTGAPTSPAVLWSVDLYVFDELISSLVIDVGDSDYQVNTLPSLQRLINQGDVINLIPSAAVGANINASIVIVGKFQ